MPSKHSIALVCGALVVIAFWGFAMASVEGDPSGLGVNADGYGVYTPQVVTLN